MSIAEQIRAFVADAVRCGAFTEAEAARILAALGG